MMPTRLLAAATHYFIYSQAVQDAPMTNKGVAEKFKVPVGSLQWITSGRCYAGGHASQKERQAEHGEVMVKVSRKKKDKEKTMVTKVSTAAKADVDDSTPAEGLQKRRRSNSKGETQDD